jgi:hypothetical protein
MLSQWFWNIVCDAEPVTVNHGVLCGASCCPMIHNHCLSIIHYDCQPLAHHDSPWFTPIGKEKHTMNHNHWLSITHNVPHLHHVVFCWVSGCHSLWAMLSQWLWIMVCYAESVAVKSFDVCWSQCVGIMVCYAEPVGVEHCELYWASGCDSWFTTTG